MVINNYPLVSIITPVYNGSEYLDDLIRSVLDQGYPNIEHIVIDDGSQDQGATVSILRKYPHLRWWSRANKGQYATMNEGLLAANGEIVCFVSADDLVSPGAVSSVIAFLSKQLYCDGVVGITGRIDAGGNSIPYYIPFQMASLSFYPYFAHLSHCSLYIKRASLLSHALRFDSSLKYVGDYDWMIRIHKAGLNIGLLKRELSKVRLHPEQTSQKKSNDSAMEARQVISIHKVNKLLYVLLRTLLYRLLFKIWLLGRVAKGDVTALSPQHWVRKYVRR